MSAFASCEDELLIYQESFSDHFNHFFVGFLFVYLLLSITFSIGFYKIFTLAKLVYIEEKQP
jgi:hypothetical protein